MLTIKERKNLKEVSEVLRDYANDKDRFGIVNIPYTKTTAKNIAHCIDKVLKEYK